VAMFPADSPGDFADRRRVVVLEVEQHGVDQAAGVAE
jgi:hypothetical protein